MPTVAISIALDETLGSDYLPSPQTVARWKETYLQVFDLPSEHFDVPQFKAERRKIIEATFDKLWERSNSRSEA